MTVNFHHYIHPVDDANQAEVLSMLKAIFAQGTQIMAAVDDLKTAYEAEKAELATDHAAILAKMKTLEAAIAAQPNTDPAIVALTAEVLADTADFHAALTPTP